MGRESVSLLFIEREDEVQVYKDMLAEFESVALSQEESRELIVRGMVR